MKMKLFEQVSFDSEVDACYITLSNEEVVETEQRGENCWVDISQSGGLVGIEILKVSQNYPLINSILLSNKEVSECV
ncbi:DUF2283 domain-containing protein [uncultured Arcticibacterium sp.]|uniref:DUF2283 domain-containing protein n=1 Tax=uncultured Arcticibacterium sp. TaxID=2173042 RepID=UPI0030F9DBE3